ncbi:MAG: hypothetical protein PHX18_06720 [Candidatus Gastranaerophilales bacterium]|nr:hypothetical protein [Candidatus Gastranaerophilales bacterium]
MIDEALKTKFKAASDFFERAFLKNKLSHAYLFTGNNSFAQYAFALNIARMLNCTGDKTDKCDCLNCQWVNANRHPAVITVSPVDFYEVNKDSKPKTVITVEQARFLNKELSKSSEFHRVIIFTSAKEGNEYQALSENMRKLFNVPEPALSGEVKERFWHPVPLDYMTLPGTTANTLLKTIEEPNSNITFFFLTKSTEDMLPTIVSRCAQVHISSNGCALPDSSLADEILADFPPKNELEAIYLAEKVMSLSKMHEIPLVRILDMLQRRFVQTLHNDLTYSRKLTALIQAIETAKLQLNSYVNPDSVLETMFINFM